MPLSAGQSLSFYEILAPLGAGAMGEVYRARDTRLDREVAVKVLPEELAEDEERLRRFEREAKTLASLNHPNVAAIYGVDQVGDTCFLALELVPGEDLAEVLARGPLPIEEALEVGRQVALGLEAAHEAGIVHRDLKPANVRRTRDGEVKVLDFGLAKGGVGSGAASTADGALLTEAGRLLGTPTYMAPEQARGRPVDRRIDVWAFGCVLFECLTGRRAFDGGSAADVIGAVLEREPDWDHLPARTPARVRELVERCLAKDPRQRLRDVGDARLELERALEEREWTAHSATPGQAGASRSRTLVAGLALGAVVGALALGALSTPEPEPARELRLSIDMQMPYLETYPRIAPNGRTVVHEGVVPGADGARPVRALFRRDLDAFESRLLPGTENPNTFCFSPGGESLAVLVERSGRGGDLTLVQVPLDGDAPTMLLGVWPRTHRREGGIAWLPGGLLVGSANPNHMVRFSIEQGTFELLEIERAFEHPGATVDVFRPAGDGRHVLGRTHYYGDRGYMSALVALDIETAQEKVVERDAEFGGVTADGQLLFSRRDTLFVAPFDTERLLPTAPGKPLAAGLRTEHSWRSAWFDLAADGTLIWLPGGLQGGRRYLAVLERSGGLTPLLPERRLYDGSVNAAPDGSYFTAVMVSVDGKRVEIWGSPVDRPELVPLLAAPGTDFLNAICLPGGRELVYDRSAHEGQQGVFRTRVEAPEESELLIPNGPGRPGYSPVGVTPDGESLVVGLQDEEGMQFSTLPLADPDEANLRPLVRLGRDQFWPKFSDDGRWLAYVPDEVDRSVVIVQRYEAGAVTGPKLRVPTPDGEVPWDFTWSRDPASGKLDIVMSDVDRKSIYSVALEDEAAGRFAEPRFLAELPDAYLMDIGALADGRLLVLLQDPEEQELDRIAVVIGALEER